LSRDLLRPGAVPDDNVSGPDVAATEFVRVVEVKERIGCLVETIGA
jgi:hypothetical protein